MSAWNICTQPATHTLDLQIGHIRLFGRRVRRGLPLRQPDRITAAKMALKSWLFAVDLARRTTMLTSIAGLNQFVPACPSTRVVHPVIRCKISLLLTVCNRNSETPYDTQGYQGSACRSRARRDGECHSFPGCRCGPGGQFRAPGHAHGRRRHGHGSIFGLFEVRSGQAPLAGSGPLCPIGRTWINAVI